MKPITSILLSAILLAPALRAGDAAAASFYQAAAAKAEAAAKQEQRAIAGVDKWLFLNSELAHLGKGVLTKEAVAPAVKQISLFQKALAAKGPELLLLLVPAKAEVYPDKLVAGAAPDLLASRQEVLQAELKAAGVNSIDLAAAFHKGRAGGGAEPFYCQRDAHWSPAGVESAADLAAASCRDAAWLKAIPQKLDLTLSAPASLEIHGDLLGGTQDKSAGSETLRLRYAGVKQGEKVEALPAPDAGAPVILMGDSHNIVFSTGNDFHCRGAGLPDHLQQRLGVPVAVVSSPGSGADTARQQLARQAFRSPDVWKNTKLIVWCFSVREITEGKWREIPLK